MKNLEVYESQISVGQVKTITTKDIVNYVELLFSPKTKAQFYFNEEDNLLQLRFSDTDLDIADLDCAIDKETLKSLINALKIIYNQINNKEKCS